MAHVVVVGAGVIGLQTAVTLLEAGYTVTIVAKHWPGDQSIKYCSSWAGAIWRTHAAPDTDKGEWDLLGYDVWMAIAEQEPERAKIMGIKKCPITIFSDEDTPWYSSRMQEFASLEVDQLPHNTSRRGYTYTSIAINPLTYLDYLLTQAKENGAQLITADLPTLPTFLDNITDILRTTASPPPSLLVNCTGLGAQHFCNDKDMYPIRGQTLLTRIHPPPNQEIFLWDGDDEVTYIVPRPGTDTFILGGTKTADAHDPAPDADISKDIKTRCRQLLQDDDVEFEVLAEQVGLRPARRGGARVEVEDVVGGGKTWAVVHNYGHAGGGFQGSIGAGRKAVGLVREVLERA